MNSTSNPNFKTYQGCIQPLHFPSIPENWVSEWETFTSSDDKTQLYSVLHHKKDWKSPRAVIILHGMGEHGGRYLHFPEYLKTTVEAVFTFDHRGHGKSEGIRGHVDGFNQYSDDCVIAIQRLDQKLKKQFGKSEIYLVGHSLGGLIALRTLFLHPELPIVAATISAPLLEIRVPVPWFKKAAASTLNRIWGSVQVPTDLDAKWVSHDQAVVDTYRADRLVHGKMTPRHFAGLLDAMEDMKSRQTGLNYPVQFLIPLQDEIVSADAGLEFFRNLKIREKELKTYPGFFHESFNETGKDQVFEDLKAWIQVHFK